MLSAKSSFSRVLFCPRPKQRVAKMLAASWPRAMYPKSSQRPRLAQEVSEIAGDSGVRGLAVGMNAPSPLVTFTLNITRKEKQCYLMATEKASLDLPTFASADSSCRISISQEIHTSSSIINCSRSLSTVCLILSVIICTPLST